MEIWFGATGLRLHRQSGAPPRAGAKSHTSLYPASQMHDQGEDRTSTFSIRTSNQMLEAGHRKGEGGEGGRSCQVLLIFVILRRIKSTVTPSCTIPVVLFTLPAITCQVRLTSALFSPSIKSLLVDVGEQAETSKKGLC